MNRIFLKSFILFYLLSGVSCSSFFNSNQTTKNKTNFKVTPPPALIGPGDIISIVSFTKNLPSGEFVVSTKGHITYPYAGEIKVSGKTPSQINKIIIEKLKDGYFRNPMLSVLLKTSISQQITVFGFVAKPMSFAYIPKITILEAITKAGGFSKGADRSSVTVMRKQNRRTYRIRVSLQDIIEGKIPNFYLLPGDIIIVPERML